MEAYIGLILSVLLNIILVVLIGRYRVQENEKDVTEEEIRQMVDAGGDSGTGRLPPIEPILLLFPWMQLWRKSKTSRRRKNIPVSWCMMIISIILSGCTM